MLTLDLTKHSAVAVGDRVFLRIVYAPPSDSGLLIPDTAREALRSASQPFLGLVLSVGDEVTRCKVGDLVQLGVGSVSAFTTADGEVAMIPQAGVVGVVLTPEGARPTPVETAEPSPFIAHAAAA